MKNLTDISIVLDRSGSMSTVLKDTIGGFNTFIEAQRKDKDACVVTLAQFNESYQLVYTATPVQHAALLTTTTYVPGGATALLDAIGRTIAATGARLAGMSEAERPDKVIFVIVTDGEENASHEFKIEQINEMISHQRDVYKWEFVFLGANQDAIKAGSRMGFAAGKTMTYAANSAGTASVFRSASTLTSNYKAGNFGSANFTPQDRAEQVAAGAQPDAMNSGNSATP